MGKTTQNVNRGRFGKGRREYGPVLKRPLDIDALPNQMLYWRHLRAKLTLVDLAAAVGIAHYGGIANKEQGRRKTVGLSVMLRIAAALNARVMELEGHNPRLTVDSLCSPLTPEQRKELEALIPLHLQKNK